VGLSLLIAVIRLSVASIILIPVWHRRAAYPQSKAALGYAIAAGICLALHFATWITSLSFTSITASTTLVTTNPIWVALFSWIVWREVPTRLTLLGIAIACSGSVLIALDNTGVHAGSHPLLGNGLALLGAMIVSAYFLLGREAQRRGMGIGMYSAIAYSTGALVLLPSPWLMGSSYWGYPIGVYIYAGLMAIASQVIGHTSLNWSVRWTSPTLVTLALLMEPVGSSLLGYLIFAEVPGLQVLLGAIVVLGGVAIAILSDWK
jgi:drug/metabolite transporter (DMT)-like permease